MSLVLSVSLRDPKKMGSLNAKRREGFVPAVVYGGAEKPKSLMLVSRELQKAMEAKNFQTSIHTLSFEDGAKEKVLLRDAAFHPVKGTVQHMDFLRVTKGTRVHLTLPLVFRDEALSPGLKRGGILNIVVHALDITADAEKIPQNMEISLKGAQVGDSIHLSDVQLPPSVKVLRLKPNATLATIAKPSGLVEEGEQQSSSEEAKEEA